MPRVVSFNNLVVFVKSWFCSLCADAEEEEEDEGEEEEGVLARWVARISRSSQTDPSHQREIFSFLFSLQPIQLYLPYDPPTPSQEAELYENKNVGGVGSKGTALSEFFNPSLYI